MAEPKVVREAALKHVDAAWDDARTERTLEGARRKHAARRTQRIALGAGAAMVLAAAVAIAVLPVSEPKTPVLANRPDAAERSVSFSDGSHAVLLDTAAEVVVERASDAVIDVRLPAGRARFEIAPRKERTFRVACGDVVVQVLGTGFELERAGARTHVRVLHGRVAVSWQGGSEQLGAGEAGWFPKLAAVPASAAEAAVESETDQPEQPAGRERARAASWRQHAERGEFQEAYRMLERERERVSDDVEELLLAADASRLSGHASEAVPYLQRVVDRHPTDPRAPLAAFTLGGVLMNQLGRPREAEAAYARARAMSPSSALSQDALARQVEAAHRASDVPAARALALEYLERYPEGRRVQAVRRFGGLP
jgi:transmembrane sensor